ncbi:hypothetical protein BO70DRAFT_425151 [Aspergillus heteromorphus CBS 117.55]|uniref:Uncharacterized protein n=1 Tax=Aspergillus heteromorphus CBS 117.55 TaxID=1448321 RepID=A0A317X1M5_9EURO|nr:uncharacterized protein BO70DRAFT_425151 [Aspergillus heteromorphus CBS 117.55]PWY92453.1 hypothetical protein BO70DRAFT_425151 [Aspergillus heteromorphus CBS 117.55]
MLPTFSPARPSPLSPRRQQQPPADPQTPQFNFSSPLTSTTPLRTPYTSTYPSVSAFGSPEHHPRQQQEHQRGFTFSSRSKSSGSPSYAQRYASTIANPMAKHTSPSARRSLFLNRVKREREDGRFENRGEQLVLMEHVAEEKRWGEKNIDPHALNEYMQYIQEEEDALDLRMNMAMSAEQAQAQGHMMGAGHPSHGHGYYDPAAAAAAAASFSDEEYDDLFMDLAGEPSQSQSHSHSQDMDMS